MTDHLRWAAGEPPTLTAPVVIAAFEGWNDAGEAATGSLRTLADRWGLEQFADIDPEEFFDFTANRPHVRIVDGHTRHIDWPDTRLLGGRIPGTDTDVIAVLGVEPGLRWRTFCSQITAVATQLGARLAITLGALLAEEPHTRPVRVIGTADDDDLVSGLSLRRSTYEGPTGIVGVFHDACRRAGLRSVSLWAAVPTYVSGPPSPPAALALLRRVTGVLRVPFDTSELEAEAVEYGERIDELVAEDDDLQGYLRRLEEAHDEEVVHDADPTALIEEVERFLRDQ